MDVHDEHIKLVAVVDAARRRMVAAKINSPSFIRAYEDQQEALNKLRSFERDEQDTTGLVE